MNIPTSCKDKITIITFTHFWKYAPSTSLIEQMLDSIYSRIDIKGCRHIINYDMKGNTTEHNKYLKNLIKLKNKYNPNIEITTLSTKNMKRSYMYIHLMKKVTTPYVLMWEHDFILEKNIDMNSIIITMDKYKEINYIRFNKRANKPVESKLDYYKPIDYWIEEEKDIVDIPLLKVCGYGGLPHIERVSWFLKYCKPLIISIPIVKKNDLTRAVNKEIYNLRESIGYEQTHKRLGTYIYGKLDEERYVTSLGEYKSLEAWGNKIPDKEWKELNEDK